MENIKTLRQIYEEAVELFGEDATHLTLIEIQELNMYLDNYNQTANWPFPRIKDDLIK